MGASLDYMNGDLNNICTLMRSITILFNTKYRAIAQTVKNN